MATMTAIVSRMTASMSSISQSTMFLIGLMAAVHGSHDDFYNAVTGRCRPRRRRQMNRAPKARRQYPDQLPESPEEVLAGGSDVVAPATSSATRLQVRGSTVPVGRSRACGSSRATIMLRNRRDRLKWLVAPSAFPVGRQCPAATETTIERM